MQTLDILIVTAVSVGFVHTLIGIDHSLPFVVLGRAQGWSLKKQLGITALCGLGHVLSSVLLGAFGIGLGVMLGKLEWIESSRGNLAAWLLIGFGLAYTAWAVMKKVRGRTHRHVHAHQDGQVHIHEHDHHREHAHPHAAASRRAVTVWSLFVIFVLGPCEPLIPLLMAPAVQLGVGAAVLVAVVFGVVTIGTMLLAVTVLTLGLRLPTFRRLEAHAHVLAGVAIAGSGLAIQLLGV